MGSGVGLAASAVRAIATIAKIKLAKTILIVCVDFMGSFREGERALAQAHLWAARRIARVLAVNGASRDEEIAPAAGAHLPCGLQSVIGLDTVPNAPSLLLVWRTP